MLLTIIITEGLNSRQNVDFRDTEKTSTYIDIFFSFLRYSLYRVKCTKYQGVAWYIFAEVHL